MNKKQLIIAFLGCFFICSVITALCFPQTKNIYYNKEGHFSFVVPDGWREFPKDVLDKFTETMNQLPGAKVELTTGFYDTEKSSTYMLLQINRSGRWSENKLRKITTDRTAKKTIQDRTKIFKDYGDLRLNEIIYDNKKHILYMKTALSTDTTKTVGISATMLSNYGAVTMVFYALEEDFNSASTHFSQIIDSFNFDKDYQYINLPEERSDKMFGILPKSLPSLALLLMAVFLYWKHFNWRKFRETRVYLIKGTVAILFAVILDSLSAFLYSSEVSHDFIDTLEIILTIVVGAIWYKEYKKIKKALSLQISCRKFEEERNFKGIF